MVLFWSSPRSPKNAWRPSADQGPAERHFRQQITPAATLFITSGPARDRFRPTRDTRLRQRGRSFLYFLRKIPKHSGKRSRNRAKTKFPMLATRADRHPRVRKPVVGDRWGMVIWLKVMAGWAFERTCTLEMVERSFKRHGKLCTGRLSTVSREESSSTVLPDNPAKSPPPSPVHEMSLEKWFPVGSISWSLHYEGM